LSKTDKDGLSYSVMLQCEFGLRLKESLAIKQDTIKEALRTNVLRLTDSDGTKNGRSRDIPIRTIEQKELLKTVSNFQKEDNLKSFAFTQTLKEQYSFVNNLKYEFNKAYNNEHYH